MSSISISRRNRCLIASTDSGKLYQFNPADDEYALMNQIQAHDTYILRCKLSPDDKYVATTSADGTAGLWKADTLAPHVTLMEHEKWVWDCDFSTDSDYCITASSDTLARLWDVATGKLITVLKGHNKVRLSVAHSSVTCVVDQMWL